MRKYAEAVKQLRDVFLFLERNSIPIPRTKFTSTIGEWLVMDRLMKEGFTPTLHSRQNDVDILLNNGKGVEVKSATWDSRLNGVYIFDRIKPEKLDYLVCVKLTDDYDECEYFVFSGDDVESLPPRNQSAFNDPSRDDNQRIIRILDHPQKSRRDDMRDLNRRIGQFHNAWHNIP